MQYNRPMYEVHVYCLLSSSFAYHRVKSWFLQYSSCTLFQCESYTHHNLDYFLQVIAWSSVDSFCASAYFEGSGIVTRRELSQNYQYCSDPIQWEVAQFYPLEYFASDTEFVHQLFANSVHPCIFGEVSFHELEQVQ